MTREQMIAKLRGMKKGSKLQYDGKIYTVVYAHDRGGKLCRHDVGWLEDGKSATYMVPGRCLAAGKMVEMSNVIHRTLYAQKGCMDFEVIG